VVGCGVVWCGVVWSSAVRLPASMSACDGGCAGCPGVPTYIGDPVFDMREMVQRDKLHASIIW